MKNKLKLLDLFCGGGGASKGYVDAGFEVVGVDMNYKMYQYYPYDFIYGDALEILKDKEFIAQFDLIHASPPCQAYSCSTPQHAKAGHRATVAPIWLSRYVKH